MLKSYMFEKSHFQDNAYYFLTFYFGQVIDLVQSSKIPQLPVIKNR